jgi:hypothetical protein
MHNKYCKEYPYFPLIMEEKERVVVIGDLHGDYEFTTRLLKKAEVIDNNLNWIGGQTIIVQVGDQVDRCRPGEYKCDDSRATKFDEASDIKIIKLLNHLHTLAAKSGGMVISLLGNHELMNIHGNMNYVSKMGLDEFDNYIDPKNINIKFKSGIEARKYAFAPGNEYGTLLACTRASWIIIGKTLFCHGGLTPSFMKTMGINNRQDLYKISINVREWALGLFKNLDYFSDPIIVSKIVNSYPDSLFWNRNLSNLPSNLNISTKECQKNFKPLLDKLNIKRMIVGHTPQNFVNNDGVNFTCVSLTEKGTIDIGVGRVDSGDSKGFTQFNKPKTNGHNLIIINKFGTEIKTM